MKNTKKIMEVALPVPEAADLALRAAGRGPCEGCDYRAPAPRCAVMRARAVVLGLPDCSGGYVYREVRWEPV